MKPPMILFALILLAGCASTTPVSIGHDTYYASKTNTKGIFGDVGAVAGSLLVEGNKFCAAKGLEFEEVSQTTSANIPGVRFGGATLTFKCLPHAGEVRMRPDNGVTTIESR